MTALRTIAAALLLTAPLAAQHFPGRLYPASWPNASLAAGDLNGDGRADLVSGGTDLVVSLRDPAGGFLAPVHHAVNSPALNVTLCDLDTDGALDVVWTNDLVASNLQWRLGDGLGGFGTTAGFTTILKPNELVVEDFDGDGDSDLALSSPNTNAITIVLSNGAGQLTPGSGTIVLAKTVALGPGDLDGDGDVDLVACHEFGKGFTVLLGSGTGSFVAKPKTNLLSIVQDVAVSDVDEDGDQDFVLVGSGQLVHRYLNNGQASFTPSTFPLAGFTGEVLFTDLDGDGIDDLIGRQPDGLLVLPGQQGPDFGAAQVLHTDSIQWSSGSHNGFALLDVDDDGLRDLATNSGFGPDVTVLTNGGFGVMTQSARIVRPDEAFGFLATDLDGDGAADVALGYSDGFGAGTSTGIRLERNDGHGVLGPGEWVSSVRTGQITSGDLDGDGDTDLVADTQEAGPQGFRAFYNDGGAAFASSTYVPFEASYFRARCGDLDGDGDDDVVILVVELDQWSGTRLVAMSNGAGGFGAPTSTSEPDGADVVLSDLNVDGNLDMAIGLDDTHSLRARLGDGDGGFSAPITSVMLADHRTGALATGDLDADGVPDVVLACQIKQLVVATIGNGSGSFAVSKVWNASSSVGPALADVDGNGRLDVVITSWGDAGKISLIRGSATGPGAAWMEPEPFDTAQYPRGVACAQMDEDSLPDVVSFCGQTTSPGFTGWPDPGFLGDTRVAVLKNLGTPEPWKYLGQGKAGAAGIPMLVGHGNLEPDGPMTLTLKGAKPLSPASLVVGLTPLFAPFKGGTLVPQPDFVLGVGTDADGGLELGATWPAGAPSGVSLWFQVWAGEAVGLAASNGVRVTTP